MSELLGLIYDMDGVIADTEEPNVRATVKMFKDLFDIAGIKDKDFEAGLGRGAEAYCRAAAEIHGLDMTAEQAALACSTRQDNILEIFATEPLPPFPGVIPLMEAALADDSYKLAVATGSTKTKADSALAAAGVPIEQMSYVNGDEITEVKPDPQIFMIASERMGIAPERCLVIEDSPNGVKAAKTAGMTVIAVTNSVPADKLGAADRIVDSLTEVSLDDITAMING